METTWEDVFVPRELPEGKEEYLNFLECVSMKADKGRVCEGCHTGMTRKSLTL